MRLAVRFPSVPLLAVALAVVVLASACGPAAPTAPPPLPENAGEALRALEARLIGADEVRVATSVRATGVVAADLTGSVALGPGVARLDHVGTFVDNPVDLFLAVEDGSLVGGNGDHRFETAVPPALREAIVVGMTRMGVLHNLARLTGAMPPDHGDGGLDGWLEPTRIRWEDAADGAAAEEPRRAIAFTLLVDGVESADVVLWLDPTSNLPVRREQATHFPQGTMDVVEEYRDWEIGAAAAVDRP
jgi:hypothetical protein